jgi:hypothetical protein
MWLKDLATTISDLNIFFFNLIFCFCWGGGVPLIRKDSFMLCVIENYIFHIRHNIVITLFFNV